MIKMKNSGIEWIGEIPDDWEIINLGNLLKEHKIPNEGLNTLALQFKFGTIVRKKEREITPEIIEVLSNYNVVEPNNIMINGLNLAFDFITQRVAIVKEKGVITSTYIAIMPTTNYYPQYATYLLKSYDNQKVFHALGRGLRCMLSYDILKREKVLYPPLYVQQKIADYLDKKCAAVDRLIGNQQAQIEKLKEYKQSVITEAVTRGLDLSVPMKASGIEWVGNIPTGWEVKRTKYVAISIFKGNGITKEDVVIDGDTPCVRYGEIYSKYNISFSQCKSRTNKSNVTVLQYFYYGDILFAGTGELVEEIGKNIVYLGKEQGLAGGDIIILRHMQNPAFLNYALYATYSQMQKSCGKAKLKVVHISATEIGNIFIVLPSITEQQQIADYLDKKCAEIDKLIAIKQQKIETLVEYKKSLIYEYVTGKIQVG